MRKAIKKKVVRKSGMPGVVKVGSIKRPRSWCFYGRSGSGKTTLSSTFPAPILLLDVRDRGTDSIADIEDVDVKEIDTFEDIEEAYYYLKENPDEYATVIIDTVTQLQQVLTEEVVGKNTKNGKALGNWGSMTRRQFGDLSAMMKEWILNYRNLTDLGIEIVFIAQERTSNVEDDGKDDDNMLIPEVGPALMPSIAMHLNANVSIIGNTFIRVKRSKIKKGNKTTEREDALYCLRVGPNPIYTTKLRKPRGVEAPSYIENPTYADVIECIKGE